MTAVERTEAEELKKIDTKARDMKIRLEQLKKKVAQQIIPVDTELNEKKKEIVFSGNQEEAIKEYLVQMYVYINNYI